MAKKVLILFVVFTLVSIPAIYKMSGFYDSYVKAEDEALGKARLHQAQYINGELVLTKEQLLNMYAIMAEAEPSRYVVKFYYYFSIALFIGGLLAFIIGFAVGHKEGSKSNA